MVDIDKPMDQFLESTDDTNAALWYRISYLMLPEMSLSGLISMVAAVAMVFGGVFPFIPQYRDIHRLQNSEGFSLFVCLNLLIANILRILFWFGKHFELPLLLQSIIMTFTMLALIRLCVTVKHKSEIIKAKQHHFTDFQWEHFWRWTDFESYIEFTISFTGCMGMLTYIFLDNWVYIETLGFLAVFAEAMLGAPQFYRNFQNKSTLGMSKKMVAMWTCGDIFKTCYFLLRDSPAQFWICGSLQVMIDISIFVQVFCYRNLIPKTSFRYLHGVMDTVLAFLFDQFWVKVMCNVEMTRKAEKIMFDSDGLNVATVAAAGAADPHRTNTRQAEEYSDMRHIWKCIYIDIVYIKSRYGILVAAELILSLLGLMCIMLTHDDICTPQYSSAYSFYEFTASTCFIVSLIWYALYVLAITKKLVFIRWDIMEIIWAGIYMFNYLIGSSLVAAHSCSQVGYSVAAIVGFICLAFLMAHEYYEIIALLDKRRDYIEHTGQSFGEGGRY